MMHGMHGYGSIWMIIWVALIILGIYLLVKFMNSGNKHSKNNHTPTTQQTPLQTLQERLAKGEIDSEEYERLKAIIKQDQER